MGLIKRLWHRVTGSLKGNPSPGTTGTPSAPVQTQAKLGAPIRHLPPAALADEPQQPAQSTEPEPSSQENPATDVSVDTAQDAQAPTSAQPVVGSNSAPVATSKPADATFEAAPGPVSNVTTPVQEDTFSDDENASQKQADKSKRYSLPVGGIARLKRLSKAPARKEVPTTTAPVTEETEPENVDQENQEQKASTEPVREQNAVQGQQGVPPAVDEQPPVLTAVNIEDTQPESATDVSPAENDKHDDEAGKREVKEPSTIETVKSDAPNLLNE